MGDVSEFGDRGGLAGQQCYFAGRKRRELRRRRLDYSDFVPMKEGE